MGRLRQYKDGERGAAIVEFAVILPLLVLVLAGILEFGRAYNMQIQLSGAAREGARVMAITNNWTQAQNAALAAAPGMTPAPTVTRTPAACTPGANMTVTATRQRTYSIPFWQSGTWNITGRGVMRCGG